MQYNFSLTVIIKGWLAQMISDLLLNMSTRVRFPQRPKIFMKAKIWTASNIYKYTKIGHFKIIRLRTISGNHQRTIASRKLSSQGGHYLNNVLDKFLLMWTNEKRDIRLNNVQLRTKEIGSNVHYICSELGEVNGQDHTNNEQTQSVDDIIWFNMFQFHGYEL